MNLLDLAAIRVFMRYYALLCTFMLVLSCSCKILRPERLGNLFWRFFRIDSPVTREPISFGAGASTVETLRCHRHPRIHSPTMTSPLKISREARRNFQPAGEIR